MISAPVIVTATFADSDFRWLDNLRQSHFPPERNFVPAHLTLFHHLPPSETDALKCRIRDETKGRAPLTGWITSVRSLGRGVAFNVDSPELSALRERLADAFGGVLIPQDLAIWRPHITIQNKVEPAQARQLEKYMKSEFRPRQITFAGIGIWAYRNGPWEAIAHYRFG